VVDSVAELKYARARALWRLKSHIATAVARGNKPILDRYLQLCKDLDVVKPDLSASTSSRSSESSDSDSDSMDWESAASVSSDQG